MKKNKIKKFLNDYMKWTPSKMVIVILLLLPILLNFNTKFKLNNDFWFLINTGKYIINNGIPHIEPFTIHSNLLFVVQQWLTDIIFYFIYSKFNIYGMYIFTIVMELLIIYLMYKVCLLISNNKIKLSIIITVLIILILNRDFITTRPHLFDILFLTLELYLLELYVKRNNKKYLLGLPLISLLMINLHSSIWPMLFVFLLPYYVGRINLKFTTKENYKLKSIIIVTIIMFIFGFINPYGIEAMKYLFNSYGIDYLNKIVGEMNQPDLKKGIIIYIFIFIIYLSYYINRKDKINLRYLLLTLGTTCLTLEHYRGVMFLLIVSIITLSDNLKQFFNKEVISKANKKDNYIYIILLIFLSLIYLYSLDFETENKMFHSNIANYLDENTTKDITLYTGYGEGSYYEYRGYKCYLDPRAEVFLKSNNKKEDILLEYYLLQHGIISYQDFIDKYNFDYILVSDKDVIYYQIIKDNAYEKVYEGTSIEDYNLIKKYKLNYRLYKKKEA